MIKAVGTVDGKVAVEEEITTTGDPTVIGLSADRRDLAHVTIRILDDRGRPVPDAGNEVRIEVEGEGRLTGMDNGDPASHEDYQSPRRKCFNGLCLALVQSTANAGGIRVTAISPGFQSSTIAVTTKS